MVSQYGLRIASTRKTVIQSSAWKAISCCGKTIKKLDKGQKVCTEQNFVRPRNGKGSDGANDMDK